jgi:hypothetical protein
LWHDEFLLFRISAINMANTSLTDRSGESLHYAMDAARTLASRVSHDQRALFCCWLLLPSPSRFRLRQ